MRKVIGAVFMSLDGVIQGPGGPNEDPTNGFDQGGWQFKFPDEQADESLGALFETEYDLLLGRRTYDIFAAYWPYVDGDMAAMGEGFSRVNKYVLTHGDQPLEWENSHRLKAIEELASVKQAAGRDLMIWGSSTIYPALLKAGLLDRLILLTYPVTLGKGKRLFGEGTPPGALKMVDHKVTAAGTVVATYEPAGPIPAEAPAAPQSVDSARERERQRRMADGS